MPKFAKNADLGPIRRSVKFLMFSNGVTSNRAVHLVKTKLLPPDYPDAEAGSHDADLLHVKVILHDHPS